MIAVGLVAALALATTFALSAVGFVREPSRVVAVLETIGLPFPRTLGLTFGSLESALPVLLVVAPRLGGALAALYLLAITGGMAVARLRGIEIADCGCLASAHEVDRSFFVRNAILIGLGVVAAAIAPSGVLAIGLWVGLGVTIAVFGLARHRYAVDDARAGADAYGASRLSS